MTERLKHPRYDKNSFGWRCADLIQDDQPWKYMDVEGYHHCASRSVTRAERPNRYWVSEEGELKDSYLRRKYIEHQMFTVASMSIARQENDYRRDLEQFWIVQTPSQKSEVIYVTKNLVKSPEEEQESGEYKDSLYFAIENDLVHPNEHDLARLYDIIEKIYQDGSEIIT